MDRGSAGNFDADPIPESAFCLHVRILGPKRNLDHRPFFRLGRYANKSNLIISFFEQSLFKLLLELQGDIIIKHVASFTCAKLTMAFTAVY